MQSTMMPLTARPDDGRGAGTVVLAMPPHPRDYVVWSTASLFYGNLCCLGLVAFYYSIKSRDQKMIGDMAGAQAYASKARIFNICVLVLIGVLILCTIIICIVTSVQASSYNRYNRYYK